MQLKCYKLCASRIDEVSEISGNWKVGCTYTYPSYLETKEIAEKLREMGYVVEMHKSPTGLLWSFTILEDKKEMKSGWIINFKNGDRIAVDEKAYKTLPKDSKEIESEEHWFSLENAIKRNPGITLIKGC